MIKLTGMANSHYLIFHWRYENAYIQVKSQGGIGEYNYLRAAYDVTMPVERNIKAMIENVHFSLIGRVAL